MTRVNIGIDPSELCDQHLVAEVHELPRVFAYTSSPNLVDGPFRLGTGHMLWCARFPGTLATRYRALVAEMQHRGFAVSHHEPRGDGRAATDAELAGARDVLAARLSERLATMKRAPRWTRREPPAWAEPALRQRSVNRSGDGEIMAA